ncbi:hypothetical protein [Homoserinimonas hongtaonis]|uniref:UDP-N-acetyl-alpha-D-muramoyl-L-alanyl-L-glutamate epimerase n=1 Tax=Homoserinimonas hongtaonis TaxID=2079791 RepID=A0A2U1SWZ1_9MICO|nr:hypothetical protein [Salinibacterium hongtaonis]PWB96147.1 hypothetical protein DF220_12265 [Salinibacterium hongtaonis]
MPNRSLAFDPAGFDSFSFVNIERTDETGEVVFHYRLNGPAPRDFAERIVFALPEDGDADWDSAASVLPLLGAVLGLSYYKAAAPPRYEIAVDGLAEPGVAFLRDAIHFGLGEFAYRAGLPGLLDVDITVSRPLARVDEPKEIAQDRINRPLVPLGGGKDSVVSVESMRYVGLDVTQFSVNPNVVMQRVASASGLPFVSARRILDPALFEANASGALNGHVPVTAMVSLIAVAQAKLLGLGPVVMSNESSAAEATMMWDGVPVNHQWSKSLDAEVLLASAIEAQTGERGGYFSLLRPFTELRIARKFAQTAGYDTSIVSCNRAFRISGAEPGWCGECAKCQFVFLAFSPFMSRERLMGIVGVDMFDNEDLIDGFRSLLGLGNHKPWECVGEEAESTVALSHAARSDDWREAAVVRALVADSPEIAQGDADIERALFEDRPAVAVPPLYEEARRALE